MDRDTYQKVKNFSKLIRSLYPVYSVILYGSYARGTENKDSDIDIAIVFDNIDGNYLQLIKELYKRAIEIDSKIETVVINKSNDKSGFLESIMKYGKIIQ